MAAARAERGTSGPSPDDAPRARHDWIALPLLAILALVAYQHVVHAGFIWDDDAHVTPPGLRSLHGLWRIWFEPGATQQYYPVLYSAFWLEHTMWGDAASWYHLANLVLHALAAFLLFGVLRRLSVPGALLAAALFASHPVCAESVAWISEQKNTLSAVFFLSAALAYLRFDQDRRPGVYALGSVLFVAALLSKSVTATLPAALLVALWWKRGRLSPRSDLLPLAPWLALGAGAGAMTAWMERTHVGASGADYALGIAGRFLVAGRALWFYLGKLAWPASLTFIYPRWVIDPSDPAQYLFPAAAVAAFAALWSVRRRARGPLAAALLFAGTLFPALGFINVFPFIYSFVADHFQYLAAAMALSGAAALFTRSARLLTPAARPVAWAAAAGIVMVLVVLTRQQCAMYADSETLWRATLVRNPACWMAYNNLANDELAKGRVDEAVADVGKALAYGPENSEAYVTWGDALRVEGRFDEAVARYGRALEIEPGNAIAHNNLGNLLLAEGRPDEAIGHYTRALEAKPDFAKALANLGNAYLQGNRLDDAIAAYGRASTADPTDVRVEVNLGTALAKKGRVGEAIAHFRRALSLDPQDAGARHNLEIALASR